MHSRQEVKVEDFVGAKLLQLIDPLLLLYFCK